MSLNKIMDAVAECYYSPLRFVKLVYPWGVPGTRLEKEEGPDKWQVEILLEIEKQLKLRADPARLSEIISNAIQIAIASGHGIGKTAFLVWIIHWFVSTRAHPQVIVTSNTEPQLSGKTWRELNKWHEMSLHKEGFTWTKTRFYFNSYPDTWGATAIPFNENRPESFAGTHEENVLIIFDEASAIPDIIWETVSGALTTPGAMWLAFGNPTRNTGYFRECWRKFRHRWITRQIDSRTAKKADNKQIQQWIDDYGEDSDFVKIRVRGLFPSASSAQLISKDDIDKCMKYKAQGYQDFGKVIACDVARFGDDETVIGIRQGRKVWPFVKFRGLSNVEVANHVKRIFDREDADVIFIDAVGLGAGVADILREQYHLPVIDFQGSERRGLEKPGEHFNKRAEAYNFLAQAMKRGIELPYDTQLDTQMQAIEYFFHGDLLQILGKDDIKAELGESPDVSDCCSMLFAFPVVKKDAANKFTKKNDKRKKGADGNDHTTHANANRWVKKK